MSRAADVEQIINLARNVLTSHGINPGDADVQRLLAHPELAAQPGARAHVGAAHAPIPNVPAPTPADIFSPGYAEPSRATRHTSAYDALLSRQAVAAVQLRHYEPPRAQRWTAEDLARDKGANRITREKRCTAVISHPLGAVVEYPETGAQAGESVAHRFAIDPDSTYRPHHSFQYSLGGDSHGGHKSVNCYLIEAGQKIACKVLDYGCQCIRSCTFKGSGPPDATPSNHSYTSPTRQSVLRADNHVRRTANVSLAEVEVFRKTLALFCALKKHGCALRRLPDFDEEPDDLEDTASFPSPSRSQLHQVCDGKIILKQNENGQSYLECEHRRKGACDHLIIRSLQDFDIVYLRALLRNDVEEIHKHEARAAALGVGPLVPCGHIRSCRSQATHCPNWHRGASGVLEPGQMSRESACAARFRIFEPLDLRAHPCIVVVCTNPHSHVPPERSMTPPLYREAVNALLLDMRWQLADATPRRIVRDSGFMSNLRHLLQWSDTVDDPVLSDLHPSLGNLDHLAHLIDEVRKPMYPLGTDFQGARDLFTKHLELPPAQRYVRFAEEIVLDDGAAAKMVICMFPSQSQKLLSTKRLEIDIQFSRVKGWYELQMETWDTATSQSTTLCRAFLTSESAPSHHQLYREIARIVAADTGQTLRFRHIHGDGLEVVTADEHRGHALGLGQFLHEVAQQLLDFDSLEPTRRVRDLSPYEHLSRIFRICVIHFQRNIRKLKGKVSDAVYSAMWSLASAEQHTDFEAACDVIRSGGKDAANWLKDKECFALAALYQPYSKIPLPIWLAGKSNTNGVEQMHRDVNRDGKGLTLLGGIMRGLQHDVREEKQARLVYSEDIRRRYRIADPGNLQYLSVQRHAREGRKRALRADADIEQIHTQLQSAHTQIPKAAAAAQQMIATGNEVAAARAVKKLRALEADTAQSSSELSAAIAQGSGRIVLAPYNAPSLPDLNVPAHLEPDATVPATKRRGKRKPARSAPPASSQDERRARPTPSSYYTTVPIPARQPVLLTPILPPYPVASTSSYPFPPPSFPLDVSCPSPLLVYPGSTAGLWHDSSSASSR